MRMVDALLRYPALHVSTAFFAHDRGCLALQSSLDVRARIARERVPTSLVVCQHETFVNQRGLEAPVPRPNAWRD